MLIVLYLLVKTTAAEALKCPNGGLQLWHQIMVLLKLSAVSPGHSETDPKIMGSAYTAQTLLASYRDELVGYFQLRSQQSGWHCATEGSA